MSLNFFNILKVQGLLTKLKRFNCKVKSFLKNQIITNSFYYFVLGHVCNYLLPGIRWTEHLFSLISRLGLTHSAANDSFKLTLPFLYL